jgi:hypothetical protein
MKGGLTTLKIETENLILPAPPAALLVSFGTASGQRRNGSNRIGALSLSVGGDSISDWYLL